MSILTHSTIRRATPLLIRPITRGLKAPCMALGCRRCATTTEIYRLWQGGSVWYYCELHKSPVTAYASVAGVREGA